MSEIKKSFEFVENEYNTIIKTTGITETDNGKKNAYDILVGKNIPKNETIIDYCYNQFDKNLLNLLEDDSNDFPSDDSDSFCSGTCVAMILAISRGDSSIRPEDVVLWDNSKDEDGKSKINWGTNGLRDWEQEEDIMKDGGQIYDNRDENTWTYAAVDGSNITTEEEYLKSIKIYLSAGLPVIIDVDGHFVVVVGVESNVKLEEATFEQLVIFDPGAYRNIAENEKYKIVTLGESVKKYNHASYRLLTPFPIVKTSEINENDEYYPTKCYEDPLDNEWSFVKDENGKKTHDPYYLAPVRKSNAAKSIIPAKQGRPLKKAIEAVNDSFMSEDEKNEKIEELKKLFTGEYDNVVYKDLTVSKNGEYEPEEGVTAYKKVSVNVSADVKSKSITENGTYSAADDGAEGFNVVNVNVPDRYEEGYQKGAEDMKKAQDIIDGECGPDEIPAPSGEGKLKFPAGSVIGADEGAIGFIARQFKKGVVITNIDSGLYAQIGYEYRREPGSGSMVGILNVYNAVTGALIHSGSPGWTWRSSDETIEISNVEMNNGYLSVTWTAHTIYGVRSTSDGYRLGSASGNYAVSVSAPEYIV